ncbi:MAG: spore coat protein [Clostridia bacterium]|nr:spore coat protein [Clostridia bacterium]
MAQITCKELAGLSDLMTVEENLVVKCKTYAAETTDSVLKNQYEQAAQRHQRHFDELYANLK